MPNVRAPIHTRSTSPGRPNKNPGSCKGPILLAEAADVEVLVGSVVLGPSGKLRCGTEAEAIPVRVIELLIPEIVVPVVEMVDVVKVVVLLGVVVDVVSVGPVVVGSDIVPVDCLGGPIDTPKLLVVV